MRQADLCTDRDSRSWSSGPGRSSAGIAAQRCHTFWGQGPPCRNRVDGSRVGRGGGRARIIRLLSCAPWSARVLMLRPGSPLGGLDRGQPRPVSRWSGISWAIRSSCAPSTRVVVPRRGVCGSGHRTQEVCADFCGDDQQLLPCRPSGPRDLPGGSLRYRLAAILAVALWGLGCERVAQRCSGGYAELGEDLVQVGSDGPM